MYKFHSHCSAQKKLKPCIKLDSLVLIIIDSFPLMNFPNTNSLNLPHIIVSSILEMSIILVISAHIFRLFQASLRVIFTFRHNDHIIAFRKQNKKKHYCHNDKISFT